MMNESTQLDSGEGFRNIEQINGRPIRLTRNGLNLSALCCAGFFSPNCMDLQVPNCQRRMSTYLQPGPARAVITQHLKIFETTEKVLGGVGRMWQRVMQMNACKSFHSHESLTSSHDALALSLVDTVLPIISNNLGTAV